MHLHGVLGCVWVCLGVLGCVCLGVLGCVWVCLGGFGCIWMVDPSKDSLPHRREHGVVNVAPGPWELEADTAQDPLGLRHSLVTPHLLPSKKNTFYLSSTYLPVIFQALPQNKQCRQ